MPQQLPQIPVLWTRYPDPRKVVFAHQSEQKLCVFAVGLLLLHSLGFDFGGIADPKLETQFCQQPLKTARISGSFHPHTHANSASLQVSIKLLGFSFVVMQLPFPALARLFLKKCNLLKARVLIYAYQQHVRLLSPSPWSLSNHSLLGSRSQHCYAIMWRLVPKFPVSALIKH